MLTLITVKDQNDPEILKLRKPSEFVENIDDQIINEISEMISIMYRFKGAGLAAPQVGLLKRMIVINHQGSILPMINPQIIEAKYWSTMEEECLSLPGVTRNIKRKDEIIIEYQDLYGIIWKRKFVQLYSHAIQHEIDHLDGKLIIDYGRTR